MKVRPTTLTRVVLLFLAVELVSILLLSKCLSKVDEHDKARQLSDGRVVIPVNTVRNPKPLRDKDSTDFHPTKGHKILEPPKSPTKDVGKISFLPANHKGISISNSWSQTRYVCGKSILPNETNVIVYSKDCPEDMAFGRVFPHEPTVLGEGMETLIVRFRDDHKKHQLENVTCNIPCAVWRSGNPTISNPASIDGTPFRFVAYSMEGSGIYKSLQIKPLDHNHHRYYATTSFQSDVPLSYYTETLWNIQFPPPAFGSTIKGASFLARNCNSVSNRENLFTELAKYASTSTPPFRVESLSSCLRNALPPTGIDLNNKTKVMRSYLFHFAFENQLTEDYITEKLWGALASGTVPVYLGAPNVLDHVPPHSIIFVHDYSSAQELITYLTTLAYNKTLYDTYHEWRRMPLPPDFQRRYDFTKAHSYCRVCRLSYALKYGWGWDHQLQQILPLKHPRTTCLDVNGWMVYPIREIWNPSFLVDTVGNDNSGLLQEDASVGCSIPNRKRHSRIPEAQWIRTVWGHDGVTDIQISLLEGYNIDSSTMKHNESILLRLQTPVNTSQLIHRGVEGTPTWQQVYWVQDGDSRVVLVFNDTITTSNLSDAMLKVSSVGSVDIVINRPIHIRIILEDIDTFHEGGIEKESFFGSLMTDEFLHPLTMLDTTTL
jgi:hypothetical protein